MKEEQLARLHAFIGKCVINNLTLPPTLMGGRRVTVQELLHNRSVESLERYADLLENEAPKVSRTNRRLGEKERMAAEGVSYTELIQAVDDMIDYVVMLEQQRLREEEIQELKKYLEKFKTRDQKRDDVKRRLAELGVEFPEDSAPPTQSAAS